MPRPILADIQVPRPRKERPADRGAQNARGHARRVVGDRVAVAVFVEAVAARRGQARRGARRAAERRV